MLGPAAGVTGYLTHVSTKQTDRFRYTPPHFHIFALNHIATLMHIKYGIAPLVTHLTPLSIAIITTSNVWELLCIGLVLYSLMNLEQQFPYVTFLILRYERRLVTVGIGDVVF